jgi:hypothetical protein
VHRNWEKGEQAMRIEVMQPTGHLNATSTNHFRQQANNVLAQDCQP